MMPGDFDPTQVVGNPYEQMMAPQQMMTPVNPHQIDPYTFTQGEGDRFPRTQALGSMQDIEMVMRQLDREKAQLDLQKDLAAHQSKMMTFARNDMKDYMQMLKGGGGMNIA